MLAIAISEIVLLALWSQYPPIEEDEERGLSWSGNYRGETSEGLDMRERPNRSMGYLFSTGAGDGNFVKAHFREKLLAQRVSSGSVVGKEDANPHALAIGVL